MSINSRLGYSINLDIFDAVLELIKKHKERVALIGMGVAFLIFIGGGIYLQKSKKQEKEPPVAARQVRTRAESRTTGERRTAA